ITTIDSLIRNSIVSSACSMKSKMHCVTRGRIPFKSESMVCMLGPSYNWQRHEVEHIRLNRLLIEYPVKREAAFLLILLILSPHARIVEAPDASRARSNKRLPTIDRPKPHAHGDVRHRNCNPIAF
ncbi:hypothetical protein M758_2G138400, partial [Ceratodon purpureus]